MFVPLKANWAAGWAPVALLADSCPALEDIHLPGGFRVVGNCLGVQEVIGQEYTSPFSWRHKLEWPVMKPPRTVARTGIPWGWRSPGASWPLCPHQWEACSGLQVANDQWCPPCWLEVYQLNRQVLPHTNLSSPHISRLPSSSGSSWGAGWGSHWLSPHPWEKTTSQTRVGTERKGSPMRHRKRGLSTWTETPNGIWILSEGYLVSLSPAPRGRVLTAPISNNMNKSWGRTYGRDTLHALPRSPWISFIISVRSSPEFSMLLPTSRIQTLQTD